MTERPPEPDQSVMPQDIATLYSRAHIKGTRYWDFSASRKEVRGQFRHRAAAEKAEQTVFPSKDPPSAIPFQAPALELQTRNTVEAVSESGLHDEPEQTRVAPAASAAQEQRPRWFALHSVFAPAEAVPPAVQPARQEHQPPVTLVFSLAGGVGKTCLVATLGRALSSLGERVLLADTAACGLLPLYFGSRESKPGVVRTFSPPTAGAESDAPVHVLNLDPEFYSGEGQQDRFIDELVRDGRNASRMLIDVATASREVTRRLLMLGPAVLVPVLPDMSSVASLAFLEGILNREGGAEQVFYLLNQFDAASSLHQDLRGLLQQRLGDRLLPFVLSRSSAVSEALAEGMTVIDYAPGSAAAEDYWNLAGWLRSVAAPAAAGFGGVRWSER